MALSDLAVFEEATYKVTTEILAQQVEKFNTASGGALQLSSGSAHQGSFSEAAMFKQISGLVRRRDSFGDGSVAEKTMQQIVDTMVKVATGAGPIRLDPGQFKWIQINPKEAGAALAIQVAVSSMADMLDTALIAAYAALVQESSLVYDATGDTPDTLTLSAMNKAAWLFGDRTSDISVWISHSTPVSNFYGTAITNNSNLFSYGTINVLRDPFGRAFVVTDSPSLFTAGSPYVYHVLGLVPGAVTTSVNNDFTSNVHVSNGNENIKQTYQSEWSFQLGVKGFSWDKTGGGPSPTNAAIATSANWIPYVTSVKNMAGVVLQVNPAA